MSEFKKLSNQDKATVYRHLSELQANGMVEQNPSTKNYRLGPAVLRLAAVREKTFPARKAVSKWVDQLSTTLGELVHVSLRQGLEMSPIYHRDVQIHGTRVYFDEAELLPMHATSSGLAMLAFGDSDLLEKVIKVPLKRYSEMTIVDPQQLKDQVAQARLDGYAFSDQGFESDVVSLAMPVFDENSEAVGTIAVALPTLRMNDTTRQFIVTGLEQGSIKVTQALGGTVPDEMINIWHKRSKTRRAK